MTHLRIPVLALMIMASVWGQSTNGPQSSLIINNQSGPPPHQALVVTGQTLSFQIMGNPNLPYLFLQGQLSVGSLVIPPEQLDLGPTLADVRVLLDGRQPVGLNLFANTGSLGGSAISLSIPFSIPSGSLGAFQVFVFDPASPLGFVGSAATEVIVATPISIVEDFNTTVQQDVGFVPEFNAAPWNGTSPGQLAGLPISGSATATFLGNPANLGTRTQVVPLTLPLTSIPFAGLFSPFDDAFGLNLGSGVNPNGGSHIMHLYEGVELGNPRDSLELVEWGPTQNVVLGTTYPQYRAWAGMTNIVAPQNGSLGAGMSTVYRANYNLPTPQAFDPSNSSLTVPGTGGVLLDTPRPYVTMPSLTTYYPFPLFSVPFDYLGSGPGSGNLILEQNIEPGSQVANLNRFRATNFFPVRRILGGPMSSGQTVGAAGGFDIYDMRFTFVGRVASAQSLFYDSGIANPIYAALLLSPAPAQQLLGTEAKWELMGATALLGPNLPGGTVTPWLTYYDGSPSTGSENLLVLNDPANPSQPQLSGHRYFRFRATLRANTQSNALQSYDEFRMVALQ